MMTRLWRRPVAGMLVVGIAWAVGGCGGEEGPSEADQAVAKLEKATGGPAAKTETPAKPLSAPALIRRYFELIDRDEFTEAWSFADLDLQAKFGGFESWRSGYATTTSTDVLEANVTSSAGDETDLSVRIRARDSCAGDNYETEFEGAWSVDAPRGKITEADFAQVSGTAPPSDCI